MLDSISLISEIKLNEERKKLIIDDFLSDELLEQARAAKTGENLTNLKGSKI